MGQSRLLPFVGLLFFHLIPNQLCKTCEVSEEKYFLLSPLWKTMTHSKYTMGTQSADVLLSLRLVGIQNQTLIQPLSQQVRRSGGSKGVNLSSGQLALITLALGACHTPDEAFIYDNHLLSRLENKFQAEIKNMAHNGSPLTNYYQLSLGALALCLFHGRYSTTQVAELFAPGNKNYYFHGQFVVDIGAMAVLALTCIKRGLANGQTKTEKEDLRSIDNHIQSLVDKILLEKKRNGLIGNTFSTGIAMQALFISSDYYKESKWNCEQTLKTVLEEIAQGVFNIPIAAAQILPALVGKTYLDVNRDSSCTSGLGNFDISSHKPMSTKPPNSPSNISIHYSVKINEIYSTTVTVPSGSVFLDVMEEAQKKNETLFGFTVEQSSWGPFITSVQGLKASNTDRTYWELLSSGRSLSQGVGNYVVHDGEDLEVRWSKY
ncbi:PREDICTED: transcobalamin-1 isoform X2 [Chinchilla lanigera]|uniref:transcobalamin-1 isoform X2 n=1 Tax=Chinchilla lanigera TaxID=34839 RepID=UPI0006975E6E|nr:PREDICTED: transcobalamin-1 isoform X2 [Chinchilla lanigera]